LMLLLLLLGLCLHRENNGQPWFMDKM